MRAPQYGAPTPWPRAARGGPSTTRTRARPDAAASRRRRVLDGAPSRRRPGTVRGWRRTPGRRRGSGRGRRPRGPRAIDPRGKPFSGSEATGMPPGSFVSRARHLRIDPDEIRRGLNKGCRFQKTKKTGEGLSPLPRYDRDELRALYSLPPATQARVLVLKTDSRVLPGAPRNRFSTAQNVLCLWVEAASQESGGSRLVVDQEGAGQCDGARAGAR